jgi:flagellin
VLSLHSHAPPPVPPAALARLGSGAKAYDTHSTFITKLSDALESGVGNLVDADLAKESARLQSLQTKQQLGIQALSIANSSSQSALSLFR